MRNWLENFLDFYLDALIFFPHRQFWKQAVLVLSRLPNHMMDKLTARRADSDGKLSPNLKDYLP